MIVKRALLFHHETRRMGSTHAVEGLMLAGKLRILDWRAEAHVWYGGRTIELGIQIQKPVIGGVKGGSRSLEACLAMVKR